MDEVEDVLGTALIPDDNGFDEPLKAVRVTGNGNCLYNALSVLLLGE